MYWSDAVLNSNHWHFVNKVCSHGKNLFMSWENFKLLTSKKKNTDTAIFNLNSAKKKCNFYVTLNNKCFKDNKLSVIKDLISHWTMATSKTKSWNCSDWRFVLYKVA